MWYLRRIVGDDRTDTFATQYFLTFEGAFLRDTLTRLQSTHQYIIELIDTEDNAEP